MPQLSPNVGTEQLRIADRDLYREMILERNFSKHVSSGIGRYWRIADPGWTSRHFRDAPQPAVSKRSNLSV